MFRDTDPQGRSSFMLWYVDPCTRSAYGRPRRLVENGFFAYPAAL